MDQKRIDKIRASHKKDLAEIKKKLKATTKYSIEYYELLVQLYDKKARLETLDNRLIYIKRYEEELETVKGEDYDPSKNYGMSREEKIEEIKGFIEHNWEFIEGKGDSRLTTHSYFKWVDTQTKLKDEKVIAESMKDDYNKYVELLNKNEKGECTKKEASQFKKLQKKYQIISVKHQIHKIRTGYSNLNSAWCVRELEKLQRELKTLEYPVMTKVGDLFENLVSYVQSKQNVYKHRYGSKDYELTYHEENQKSFEEFKTMLLMSDD